MQKKVSLKKHLYSIASLLETRHLYNKIIKALQYCKIMSYKTTAVFSAKQVSECTGTTRVYLHWRERVKQNITEKDAWFTSIKDTILET